MSTATAKCLRFKEPEVDDYVVYKYTESESTEEEEEQKNDLDEIKEEEEEDIEEGNLLISENEIRNSIELLSHDKSTENQNAIINNDVKENENENINKSNSSINKSYESMESFEVYKEGDGHIIEGIPQIEVKLNISRDNLLANSNANANENENNNSLVNLGPKKSSAQNIANNIIKYSNASLNSIGSNNVKISSKNSSLNSQEKLNKNENVKAKQSSLEKSSSNPQLRSNTSIHSKHSKPDSHNSLQNVIPGQECNTKTKSIADRSKERTLESQKKMQERKLMRKKLRSELNEKRNSKEEVSININNLENSDEKAKENINEEQGQVKLVAREKPLTKNSSTNVTSTEENSDTVANSNPYTPRKNPKDSVIIPKKNEDINQLLKEIGETHFLIDDRGITIETVLEILDQTEVSTINETLGDELLDNATHMKNYEHGAIFRLPADDNHILKIIPFDPERNDLDLDRNIENNQVSLKTILQEVVATTVLSALHASGDVSCKVNNQEENNNNQVLLEIEDDQISNEKKILSFAKPEGMFICKGSTNQAFNYEIQNYQLNGFSQDQYFLVTLFNNKGEIVNSNNNSNRSLDQMKSVLWQVCYSLAIAEESLGFEHRELYPECILIEEVPREELIYPINDKEIIKDNFGVKATILDYSRSRLEYKGKVYYSDLTSVIYDDPAKTKSLEDIKTVLDSTWYQSASIVNRASFADLIQSFSWITECDKAMTNWLYNNMLEFAVRVEYNVKSMKEVLNDPFWDISRKNWETRKLSIDSTVNENQECIIL